MRRGGGGGRTRDVGPLPAGGGAAGTYSVRWPVARQGRIQSVGSAGVLSVFLRILPASSCIDFEIEDEESKRKLEASAEMMASEKERKIPAPNPTENNRKLVKTKANF